MREQLHDSNIDRYNIKHILMIILIIIKKIVLAI